MMEDELFAALSTNTALAAIVAARIYPVILKEGSIFPALTYQRISSPAEHSLQGRSGLSTVRLQVTCWAESFSAVASLKATVRDVIHSIHTAAIQHVGRVLDERPTFEPDPKLYRVDLDFEVWVAE